MGAGRGAALPIMRRGRQAFIYTTATWCCWFSTIVTSLISLHADAQRPRTQTASCTDGRWPCRGSAPGAGADMEWPMECNAYAAFAPPNIVCRHRVALMVCCELRACIAPAEREEEGGI